MEGATLLIARLVLAAVFVVAVVAKLADRSGFREAIGEFGISRRLAGPLAIFLPLAELAIASALIPTATAWWGALGAFAFLLVFSVGIGINLARGNRPDCRCFGQLHSAPAGWSTLGRNGILAAVAGFVLWQGYDGPGPSPVNWLGVLSIAQLTGLAVGLVVLGLLAGQWWFLVHLLRQNGRLMVRIDALERILPSNVAPPSQNGGQPAVGLPVGAPAPSFSLSGLSGETSTLEALRIPGKPIMLIFTDPNCGPCTRLLPEIGRWQQEHADKLTISLISRGTPEQNRAKSAEHGLIDVLLQKDWEVSEVYRVEGTPSAVLVGPDGTIGSSTVGGVQAIRTLVARAVGGSAPMPEQPTAQGEPCPDCGEVHHVNGHAARGMVADLQVGKPAPPIKLPAPTGKTLELRDFRGEETLVVFWNPGCGFCQQMLPDLKEWKANPPEGAPRMLVVSTGTAEANEAMGLHMPVVLDHGFDAGRAFGVSGTPSAVLVDAEGNVASEVALGAPEVLELARARRAEGKASEQRKKRRNQ